MAFCRSCGKELTEGVKFCTNCGTSAERVANNTQIQPNQIAQGCHMGFGDAISKCFNNYANFDGRASKAEFWWFYLFELILSILLNIFDAISGLGGLVVAIGDLVLFMPGLAVAVRRFHDTNRSGWVHLWAFTIIGLIPLIVWAATKSDDGDNRFGSKPTC